MTAQLAPPADPSVSLHNAAMAYRMPKPEVGQSIRYWRHSDITPASLEAGLVLKVSLKTLHVLVNGMRYTSVKHVTDPRLEMSMDQRADGAWDFSEEYYHRLDFEESVLNELSELESRLKAMEDRAGIESAKTPQQKANAQTAQAFADLRTKAKEAGMTDVFRRTKVEINEFLAAREAEAAAEAKAKATTA